MEQAELAILVTQISIGVVRRGSRSTCSPMDVSRARVSALQQGSASAATSKCNYFTCSSTIPKASPELHFLMKSSIITMHVPVTLASLGLLASMGRAASNLEAAKLVVSTSSGSVSNVQIYAVLSASPRPYFSVLM